MTSRHVLAAGAVFLVVVGCSALETPSPPTSPTLASERVPAPVVPQKVALGEVVEVELNATVSTGTYCEIGNDPVPCAWFVADVPRAGTVMIRMDFDSHEPMFVEIGNLAIEHLSFVTGGSPLVASASVRAGALPFRAGLNVPWGINGSVVRFRLIATFE